MCGGPTCATPQALLCTSTTVRRRHRRLRLAGINAIRNSIADSTLLISKLADLGINLGFQPARPNIGFNLNPEATPFYPTSAISTGSEQSPSHLEEVLVHSSGDVEGEPDVPDESKINHHAVFTPSLGLNAGDLRESKTALDGPMSENSEWDGINDGNQALQKVQYRESKLTRSSPEDSDPGLSAHDRVRANVFSFADELTDEDALPSAVKEKLRKADIEMHGWQMQCRFVAYLP